MGSDTPDTVTEAAVSAGQLVCHAHPFGVTQLKQLAQPLAGSEDSRVTSSPTFTCAFMSSMADTCLAYRTFNACGTHRHDEGEEKR